MYVRRGKNSESETGELENERYNAMPDEALSQSHS